MRASKGRPQVRARGIGGEGARDAARLGRSENTLLEEGAWFAMEGGAKGQGEKARGDVKGEALNID